MPSIFLQTWPNSIWGGETVRTQPHNIGFVCLFVWIVTKGTPKRKFSARTENWKITSENPNNKRGYKRELKKTKQLLGCIIFLQVLPIGAYAFTSIKKQASLSRLGHPPPLSTAVVSACLADQRALWAATIPGWSPSSRNPIFFFWIESYPDLQGNSPCHLNSNREVLRHFGVKCFRLVPRNIVTFGPFFWPKIWGDRTFSAALLYVPSTNWILGSFISRHILFSTKICLYWIKCTRPKNK